MMNRPRVACPGRVGFTMIELLVLVVTVAILSTIAMPQLQAAIARARASNVLGDLNTVRLAAYEALAESGNFPPQDFWGAVPSELAARLPDNFSFNKSDIRYRWRLFSAATSPFGVETGRFGIRLYAGDERFLDALASMGNDDLILLGDSCVHFWILL